MYLCIIDVSTRFYRSLNFEKGSIVTLFDVTRFYLILLHSIGHLALT